MEPITAIREKLPDALLAKLDFDVVLSKRQIVEKVEALEPTFGGMAVHYDHSGKRLEVIWSKTLQQRWFGKLSKGQKVMVGKQRGTLADTGAFWCGPDRCVSVDFGKGGEAYDITNVIPAE